MNVKEFLNLIDLETLQGQSISIIITLKDKIFDLNKVTIGDKLISEKEKVIFTCDETSIYEDNHYAPFGIEPCFKDDKAEDIDVRTSDDDYCFVYDDDGMIWVII